MKKFILFPAAAVILLLCSSFFPSSEYVPIFMLRDDMEQAVKLHGPRSIYEPGKIYYKTPYLFIVEKLKGVHIIDNSNPENPEKIGFLHVDGIKDVAVKGDVLYADNAVDLIVVTFDVAITTATVSKRIRNYFPQMRTPDGWGLPSSIWASRPENSVIVGWKKLHDETAIDYID